MVLVLAGASLLVFPPDQRGVLLVAWVLIALIAAFVLVFVGARIWPGRRV